VYDNVPERQKQLQHTSRRQDRPYNPLPPRQQEQTQAKKRELRFSSLESLVYEQGRREHERGLPVS
jgi:hypothetical protein